jgi:hypothetical protein
MAEHEEHKGRFPDRLIIALLLLIILAKGIFSFLVVGDRGQPSWEYQPVSDLPASSPYAIYEPLPYPQHVMGEKGE